MSAVDQMRDMINQLMGSDRAAEDGRPLVPFTDSRVCRTFLLGCCPHEVLSSTRMDMGDCPKIHEIALRADFEKAQQTRDYFYDVEAHDTLDRFFYDCDHKRDMAKKKLLETQEELPAEAADKAEMVLELNEKIGKTLAEAEKLGEEGRVTESLALMAQLETLKKDKQEADAEFRGAMPASSYQQQKLRVCDICAAYLGIHDNDRRLADHFGGKLHVGFVYLREKLAELKVGLDDRRAARDQSRRGSDSGRTSGSNRGDRRRSRSRDGGEYSSGRGDRDRDRGGDRDRAGGSSSSSRRREESSRSSSRRDRSRSPRRSPKSGRDASRGDNRGRYENGGGRR